MAHANASIQGRGVRFAAVWASDADDAVKGVDNSNKGTDNANKGTNGANTGTDK